MRKRFLTLLLVIWTAKSPAQNLEKERLINEYLQTNAEYGRLIGSVLVATQEGIIYKKGFGNATYTWNIANTPQTKFKIASISKQFTALLVLQLVQEGKLKLEDNIANYLPDYPKDKASQISIHHLLSHTSGITHYFPDFYEKYSRNSYTPQEFIHTFQDMNLLFKPGSDFRYSSFGYVLLGVILEKVTGKTYEALLEERICRPLGMRNTGIDNGYGVIADKAEGYLNTGILAKAPFRDMSTVFATGQIYSTVEDLYVWHKALETDTLLTEQYRKLLFTPNKSNYSYGWIVKDVTLASKKAVHTMYHTGGFNGFNAIILRDLDKAQLVVILANAEPTDVEGLSTDILHILYEEPVKAPKKSITKAVGERIDSQGLPAGLAYYGQLKQSAGKEYDFAEGALLSLSELYFMQKKWAYVIGLIEHNIKEYPDSSLSYVYLASTHDQLGNEALATKFYKKSLELNPNDSFAKAYLQKKKGNKISK